MYYRKYRQILFFTHTSIWAGLSLICILTVLLCTDARRIHAAEETCTPYQGMPLPEERWVPEDQRD